ncbi:MAG: GrpB family protein [Burkholderiaceae bacterium]|nr:MAG: GrpB family protein [Burkholderiaceae bacterium]
MRLHEPDQYQADVIQRFERLHAGLVQAFGPLRLEHVGSSAVPGAVSKGDLDACLIVPPMLLAGWVSRLEAVGYRVKADTLRTPELCMLEMHGPHDAGEHAVQLIAEGSSFEDFLRFRDLLRADAALVRAYNGVKRDAAHLDDAGYRAAKAHFIEAVLAGR